MDESSPDVPAKPAPVIANNAAAILDQYKAYLADVGNIGTRLTTTNGFYVSVITALLGVLALTKDKESYSDLQQVLGIAIPFFALLICWIWRDTMRFYSQLFRVKFDVLRELEKEGGLYPVFERENAKFKPNQWLYKSQSRIPFVLALPFVVILLQRICRLIAMCCDGA
jgi:hypothetical protein